MWKRVPSWILCAVLSLSFELFGQNASILHVFAASSLVESLSLVAKAWENTANAKIKFFFEGSSRLARQIVEGAPADLFFSADAEWMDWLDQRGQIRRDSRVSLFSNRMVLVVTATSTNKEFHLAHLAQGTDRLAVAGESVPAGRYAREILTYRGIEGKLRPRLVNAESVRGALRWVAIGEVKAGMVFETDARAEPKVRIVETFSEKEHSPIEYQASMVASSLNAKLASQFLSFCRSNKGRSVFEAAGFRYPQVRP